MATASTATDTTVPAAPATAPTSRHEAATTRLPPSAADTANPADPAMPCHALASPRRQDGTVHFLLRQNKGIIWTDSDGTGFPNIPGPLRTVRETVETPRQEQIQFKWRHPDLLLSSLFNWYLLLKAKSLASCHIHYNFAIITRCKIIFLMKTLLCYQHPTRCMYFQMNHSYLFFWLWLQTRIVSVKSHFKISTHVCSLASMIKT